MDEWIKDGWLVARKNLKHTIWSSKGGIKKATIPPLSLEH
jgi:hypothetical protein